MEALRSEQLPPDQQKFVRQEAGMNQRVNVDKTGYRMGIAPVQEIADKMKQLALEVRNYISGKRVKDRLNTEIPKLEEFVSLLKGMVMIAYPGYHGLPEWDFVFQLLEDKLDTNVLFPDVDVSNSYSSGTFQMRPLHGSVAENSTEESLLPNKLLEVETRSLLS